eukprot:1842357-Rhodomonas_salina.1
MCIRDSLGGRRASAGDAGGRPPRVHRAPHPAFRCLHETGVHRRPVAPDGQPAAFSARGGTAHGRFRLLNRVTGCGVLLLGGSRPRGPVPPDSCIAVRILGAG